MMMEITFTLPGWVTPAFIISILAMLFSGLAVYIAWRAHILATEQHRQTIKPIFQIIRDYRFKMRLQNVGSGAAINLRALGNFSIGEAEGAKCYERQILQIVDTDVSRILWCYEAEYGQDRAIYFDLAVGELQFRDSLGNEYYQEIRCILNPKKDLLRKQQINPVVHTGKKRFKKALQYPIPDNLKEKYEKEFRDGSLPTN